MRVLYSWLLNCRMDLIMIITGNILDRKLPKISRINSQTSGKLFFLFWWLHEKFSRDFEIVSFSLKGLLLFRVLCSWCKSFLVHGNFVSFVVQFMNFLTHSYCLHLYVDDGWIHIFLERVQKVLACAHLWPKFFNTFNKSN